jgi:glycosyltransferase involved in cell wall biosynthesis
VLLEAAFLGVPAVASRVGGSPDVFGDLDDTFAAGDADAAAERVLTLIGSPAVAVERVERMRRRAFELFTAERMANQWFVLYEGEPRKHEMHETHETRTDLRVFFRGCRVVRDFRG